ncbi:MAG: YvcK family protein [Blastocatellia bacterium]|nr:YvcK family protein [Blastocatellia bacterium]
MTKKFPPPSLKCVAIGGGTGLSTLLKGLKAYVSADTKPGVVPFSHSIDSLTAVVTVTDDGGSSGRLREEFQMLPPGDIRNCLVALSEDELLLSRLFQYRFPGEGNVRGHSFGNLFLAALTGVTGDFLEAVKLCSEVLAIRGQIFPSTMTDVSLVGEFENGQFIKGETKITALRQPIRQIRLEPENCQPLPETLDALEKADIITLGPGSLFTSIIPNLLVKGVPEAIANSRAVKIYIGNIMTQPGETDNFTAADHIKCLLDYLPPHTLDVVLLNAAPVSETMQAKYLEEGAQPIYFRPMGKNGRSRLKTNDQTIPILSGDLLEESSVARHSPVKLAQFVLQAFHQMKKLRVQRSGFRVQGF